MSDTDFIQGHRDKQLSDYLDREETIEDIMEYDIVEIASMLADKTGAPQPTGIGVFNLLQSILSAKEFNELAKDTLDLYEDKIKDAYRNAYDG